MRVDLPKITLRVEDLLGPEPASQEGRAARADARRAFERLGVALNDAMQGLARAINTNDASAYVVEGSSSADLPTPSVELRGRLYLVARAVGSGANDALYLCRKNAADAYEWALVL